MNEIDNYLNSIGDFTLRRRVKNILSHIPNKGSLNILDFGCGEGVYTYIINKITNHKITSLDYDESIISNLEKLNLNQNVKKIILDAEKDSFPFRDQEFDLIILSEVLEHLYDDVSLLSKLHRYLKNDGKIIITVPHYFYPINIDPFNGIRRIFKMGNFNPKNTFLGGMWSYDHKRLYKSSDLSNLEKSNNYKISYQVGLTKYVFPFYYHILRSVKILMDLSPNAKITQSLNKFNPKKNLLTSIFKLFYLVFELYDKLNKDFYETKGKFVTYLIILEKNN